MKLLSWGGLALKGGRMRLVEPVRDHEPFETPHASVEQGTPQKDEYPLIPEGSYQVQFISSDRPVKIFGPEEN